MTDDEYTLIVNLTNLQIAQRALSQVMATANVGEWGISETERASLTKPLAEIVKRIFEQLEVNRTEQFKSDIAEGLNSVLRSVANEEKNRANIMPNETDALRVMSEAMKRLQDLGFRNIMYSPKDGTSFEAVEAGCTKVIDSCHYFGELSSGRYLINEGGDVYPSQPILFREKNRELTE